jgi:hypothetical protein
LARSPVKGPHCSREDAVPDCVEVWMVGESQEAALDFCLIINWKAGSGID